MNGSCMIQHLSIIRHFSKPSVVKSVACFTSKHEIIDRCYGRSRSFNFSSLPLKRSFQGPHKTASAHFLNYLAGDKEGGAWSLSSGINCRAFSTFTDQDLLSNEGANPATTDSNVNVNIRDFSDSPPIMKVLNVAEKNDAAKRIANLLANGVVQTRDGYSVYNKLYQFQYNFRMQPCQMVMTSVSGHLLNCEFDQNYRRWTSCDPLELFNAPVRKFCSENMVEIKRTLEQQAAYAQVLIIWTDCDREGENIGYEVISVCQSVNPRLQILRAKFSEITKHAVTTAMNNLIQPDKRVSDAVEVRQELDLRIGAAFTRFQTLRFQKKFPGILSDRLISYGSCQFPTLGFVVERYKSIMEFIREDFWKIDVSHKVKVDDGEDRTVNFSWVRVRLFNKLAVQTIYEACLDNPMARVVKVQSKPKSKWRPVALDTIEFEKLASRKLRIGAKEAMQIAEQLYTSGFISYPRTETNIFPPSLNLAELIQQQTGSSQWGGFAARVLQQPNGPNPRNGKKSDQAHPPIHPTKFDELRHLSDKHRKVFELIVRHFLACCSKDAQGEETVVEIEISRERFVVSGLTVKERNYLEVYIYDKWSDKELPEFTEGQTFHPTKIEMNEGMTSPPQLLTEADLIALMEKHGIGTDATHAEHIETIKQRQYVGLQGQYFVPGKLGMGLVEGYDSMGFEMSKPYLRAQLEADLQNICEGRRRPDDVLKEQVRTYKEVFIETTDKVTQLDQALARLLTDAEGGNPNPGRPPGNRRGGNGDDDDEDGGGGGAGGGRIPATGSSSGSRNSRIVIQNATRSQGHGPSDRNAGSSTSATVTCHCGNIPDLRTTRKEGPNLGRQFLKCDTCGFFDWVTEAGPGAQSNSSNQRSFNSSGYGTQSSQISNTSVNSNMGPPPVPPSRSHTSNARSNFQQRSQNFQVSSQSSHNNINNENLPGPEIPMCGCNLQAGSYTVRKEGANKGRKFFGCAIPFGSPEPRCDFFKWDDEGIGNSLNSSNGGNSFSRSGFAAGASRGRGGSKAGAQAGQPGAKRARRCGICHQTGHTRRNCPLAGGDEDDEEMDYS